MEASLESELMTSSTLNDGASSSSCSQYLTAQAESIEDSKVHWSVLSECDSELSDDQIIAQNKEVFESLQMHPQYGTIFRTYDKESGLSLVVQDKFAEGGQAEIFNVSFNWPNMTEREWGFKWVLKVFKKATLLQHLQSQWPHGFLQWRGGNRGKGGFRPNVAIVDSGVLLPTGKFAFLMRKEVEGKFAFLMRKEVEDLRKLIVRMRPHCGYGSGPFEKKTMEHFFYQTAMGMDWLHKRNIIHRDFKASNVLVSRNRSCYVADYECSIGVIGTGYWRDPQILQACRERNASQRPELFSRAADVYSYGITCYEILTGKLPFEEEDMTIDLVIEGQRPKVPEFVDDWIKNIFSKCWETNRDARPTFEEILNIIVANTSSSRIKSEHEWRMKMNNEEIEPLLGCDISSHSVEMMEYSPYKSGVYMCKLCFKQGHGRVYHCSSCGDFDLHPECATIPIRMKSFLHPHDVYLRPSCFQSGRRISCDACQLEVVEGNYYNSYRCFEYACDFDLHIHCARYPRAISHHLHEDHELVLMYSSTFMEGGESSHLCNGCSIRLGPLEIVYSCSECGFNIHPHCILGKLECKSW